MTAAILIGTLLLIVIVWTTQSRAARHRDDDSASSLADTADADAKAVTGGTRSLWDAIPSDVRDLLFVSSDTAPVGTPGLTFTISINIEDGKVTAEEEEPEDPSTIYLKSPIRISDSPDLVPRPSYYPSYAELSPEQKWYYLRWLANVDSPIDIGFVFIYYYGLERRLLTGDFDAAFDMILRLRRNHENPSFQSYSGAALVYSTVFRNRPDRLKDAETLLDEPRWGSEQLLLCARLGIGLTAANVVRLIANMSNHNRRYLKNNPDEYQRSIAECLVDRFGTTTLDLEAQFPFLSLERHQKILFANYVLPDSVRSPEVPDYFADPRFVFTLTELHESAHELTKARLRAKRGGETT